MKVNMERADRLAQLIDESKKRELTPAERDEGDGIAKDMVIDLIQALSSGNANISIQIVPQNVGDDLAKAMSEEFDIDPNSDIGRKAMRIGELSKKSMARTITEEEKLEGRKLCDELEAEVDKLIEAKTKDQPVSTFLNRV